MIISLLLGSALAAGLHAGIPVQGVDGLGAPTFLLPDSGWEAPVLDAHGQPRGVARVYVAPTEAAAQAWVETAVMAVQATMVPVEGLGDLALRTDTVTVARDGNVALSVSLHDGDATALARDLVAAIEDVPLAWPQAPVLTEERGLTCVRAPGAVELAVTGGRRPLGEPDCFSTPPGTAVAWDGWGRATELRLQRE